MRAQDYDLASFQSGAIVDRGTTGFAHVAIYRSGQFEMEQVQPCPGLPLTSASRTPCCLRAFYAPFDSLLTCPAPSAAQSETSWSYLSHGLGSGWPVKRLRPD